MSEWIKAIGNLISITCDKPPKDWKTSEQIAEELNCSISHAQRIILKLRAKDLVDTRIFKVKGMHKAYPVPHYKIKGYDKSKSN
jgi:predicted transcriptional regulator